MAKPERFKPKVSRTPTAEDVQKQDIVLRWVELINAVAFLKRRLICGEGSTTKALSYFIEKFYSFFYATRFYISESVMKETESLFSDMGKGKIDVNKAFQVVDKYVFECYRKGMFIEEEMMAEEGF